MSTISLGRSGIVGISYSETSLLKSNLMRANERRNSASNNINSAKVKLQVNGRSGRIRVETDNLQSYYSSLKSNNSKIEKIIRDIDYIVRRFKEVDSRCASRVRAISRGYKVQSCISKIGNSLISFGNNVFNGISNFFKDGISIIKNIYNSSVSWTNSYGFYGNLASGNFNLGMYPGLAMAGMGVGAGVTTLGPIISGGVTNSNKGIEEYLKKSFKQVILGEFTNTDDITLLGTVGEIGVGFTPIGIAQDGRDLVKCFVDWEWSWKHIGWTAFGLVALIPGVSELKKLFKGFNNVSDIAKDTSKVVKNIDKVDEVSDTIKRVSNANIKYDYNMIENPGPLAKIDGQPASNFYGGKYNIEVLTEDRIYYRAGQDGKPLGQWFTSEPAESVTKVRIDTAVKEQWIDQVTGEITGTSIIDTNYAIKIPKGTTVYTGPVGYQGGVYLGGEDIIQTFIHEPWKLNVEVINKTPLK